MNVDNLLNNLEDTNVFKKYLFALIEKETWPETDQKHQIFHYDYNYQVNLNDNQFNNDDLVALIDNFSVRTFSNLSFSNNLLSKIVYIAAIRVWIEKQFYNLYPNDNALHGKSLGEKINYMFPDDGTTRWNGSPSVTRKYLMSKKVMLNQNIHYNSQILPFYYILNISLNDICKEIIDIKSHFAENYPNDAIGTEQIYITTGVNE
jgi:hypothetical protein